MARVFETDDRVIMIRNNAVRKGIITQTFEYIPSLVIVKFEDGEYEKVNPDCLAPYVEPTQNKPTPKPEVKSARTATIDEEGFARLLAKTLIEDMFDAPSDFAEAFVVFCSKLNKNLFYESNSDA